MAEPGKNFVEMVIFLPKISSIIVFTLNSTQKYRIHFYSKMEVRTTRKTMIASSQYITNIAYDHMVGLIHLRELLRQIFFFTEDFTFFITIYYKIMRNLGFTVTHFLSKQGILLCIAPILAILKLKYQCRYKYWRNFRFSLLVKTLHDS